VRNIICMTSIYIYKGDKTNFVGLALKYNTYKSRQADRQRLVEYK